MAKGLQELRKEAGYSSARSFAEAIGVPATTYIRYENNPDRIPMKVAWQLADRLGASIDQVVGREPAAELTGQVQRAYDELLPRSQAEMRDLLEFFTQRDEREREDMALRARQRWDAIASRIDRAFLARLAEGGPDELILTGTDEELRRAYEAFAREWVVGSERPLNPYEPKVRDEAALEAVMDSYDDMHGTMEADGVTIRWSEDRANLDPAARDPWCLRATREAERIAGREKGGADTEE